MICLSFRHLSLPPLYLLVAAASDSEDEYQLLPVLEYCEKWIGSYKNNHVLYFITGMYSMHVNYAITLIEKYDFTFSKCFSILMHVFNENKHNFFDGKYLESVCEIY